MGVKPIAAPIPALDQQHFLDLLGRLLPESYLGPLMQPGPGYEVLEAWADIGARASEAVAHEATGQYIGAAPDGAYAKGTVAFKRTGTSAGQYTIKEGTIVVTPYGYQYSVDAPGVEMPAGSTGPVTANVTALVRGYLWNVAAPKVRSDGEVLSGGINTIVAPLYEQSGTPVFDPTVYVVQTSDVVGGVDPMLDALGRDRGITRSSTTSTEDYRVAIEQLPDTVSPQAILRAVQRFMAGNALTSSKPWDVIEAWEAPYQGCYDAPVNGSFADPNFTDPANQLPQNFTSNVFVYGDPRPIWMNDPAYYGLPYHITNRYLDSFPTIIVALPDLGTEANNTGTYSALAGLLTQIKPAGVQLQFILEGQ